MEILSNLMDFEIIALMIIGSTAGIIFGSVPGLSSTTGVALVLPFTYTMDVFPSIALLLGVYFGGMSGGLIPAILMKIPGTPASVATTFDGYPMVLRGEASRAMGIGICSSLFGGLFSAFALIFCAPLLSAFALSFGPFEYFGVTFFALMIVSSILDKQILKGYISLGLGLLMSCIGSSPIDGVKRFDVGISAMAGGFQLMSVVIGMFAVAEMFNSIKFVGQKNNSVEEIKMDQFFLKFSEWRKYIWNLLAASVIGTIAGILPGLSGGPGSMMSYVQAKKMSKNPEKFGTGCPEGVIASEAANNAVTGGALIPLFSLGVPGDTATGLLMGALAIQGVQVGPILFQTDPTLVESVLYSSVLINIIVFCLAVFALRMFINILNVPKHILIPIIIVFCVLGCYSANQRLFDVYTMLIFGYLGYILDKNGYNLTALILGFLLGGTVESYLRRALIFYGSFEKAMVGSNFGGIFVVIGVLYPIISIIIDLIKKQKSKAKAKELA